MGDEVSTDGPRYPKRETVYKVKPASVAELPMLRLNKVLKPGTIDFLISYHTSHAKQGRITGETGQAVVDLDLKSRMDVFIKGDAPKYVKRDLDRLTQVIFDWLENGFAVKNIDTLWTEDYRVGLYLPGDKFARHRDNDSPGTESRLFSVVIALKIASHDTDGVLRFPDYRAAVVLKQNECVVFSSSMYHEVTRVNRLGQRYVLVTFIHGGLASANSTYDEETGEYIGNDPGLIGTNVKGYLRKNQ